MPVLLWIAVLIGIWCVASVGAAIALGTFLRHRHEATDSKDALRPLDTGPLRLWVAEFPDVPDVPDDIAGLAPTPGARSVPSPRTGGDDHRTVTPAVR